MAGERLGFACLPVKDARRRGVAKAELVLEESSFVVFVLITCLSGLNTFGFVYSSQV